MSSRTALIALLTSVLVFGGSGGVATAATPAADDPWKTDKVIASDDFGRANQQGWGSATTGGAYQLNGAPSFSVVSKKGVVAIPSAGTSRMANLSSIKVGDATTTAQFSVPTLAAAGSGLKIAVYERQNASAAYRATATITPAGTIVLVVGRIDDASGKVAVLGEAPAAVSGAKAANLTLQLRATGTSPVVLSSRIYATGGAVPDWSVVATDASAQRLQAPGVPGVWAYTSQGSSVATVSFDKLTVESVVPVPVAPPTPTPTPTVTTAPVPVPVPDPVPVAPVPVAPVAPPTSTVAQVNGAGSPAVGSAKYSIPAGALFVSPSGSDTRSGSESQPVKTIAKAIELASSGKTIVLRAGSYHETLVLPSSKALTIQNYPGEAAWLDGSSAVSGFVKSGATWTVSGWTTSFDSSPTYSRGKPDNTQKGWAFLDPAFPMAAHPDQVWVGDKALAQVASRALVVAGTFYVDEAGDKLIVGSDPSKSAVTASTLVRALTMQGSNSTIKGIGVRRYAPSIPDMGAVRVDATAKAATLQDVLITENSTTGLSVAGPNATISSVTSSNNGFLGIHSVYADGLKASKLLVSNNNTEKFNQAPAAGGFKVTRARNISVNASVFAGNNGNGLWFDESVYNVSVTNSSITGNAHHGLMFELSQKLLAANNYVADNGDAGIKVYSSGGADLVNNTVVRNWMNVYVVQDSRRASSTSQPGHDPRQPLPDPTVPWYVQNITVLNNVIGDAKAGTGCSLCIQDSTKVRTGAQMNITMKGNLFTRVTATAPKNLIMWPAGSSGTVSYKTITEFMAATRQADPGVDYVGSLDKNGAAPAATIAQALAESSALSSSVATTTGIKPKTTVGANHK